MEEKNVVSFISEEQINKEEFDLICKIVAIRLETNVSQKELGDKAGISQPNIARFEKNIHTATLATTLKILNALGYTLDVVKIQK